MLILTDSHPTLSGRIQEIELLPANLCLNSFTNSESDEDVHATGLLKKR